MSSLFERLAAMAHKPARLVVGVLSGTSADAIDVVICRIRGDGLAWPRYG